MNPSGGGIVDMVTDSSGEPPVEYLIGVRVRATAFADDYWMSGLDLRVGDFCVVEGPAGSAVGEVRRPRRPLPEFKRERPLRRVIGKAEHTEGKANPRFVVTSLKADTWLPQSLYEDLYCARGDMENRIKEQLSLFADRVSAETMCANQIRLYFSAIAYVLVLGLRRLALTGTDMANAQVNTIRLRLLKIGALLRITVRRIWISMASSYPYPHLFRHAWAALRC